MSLRKTADADTPHATYTNEAGWTWKVLRVNQPGKSPRAEFSTWMVAAQSQATFGGWDYGDTYCRDVLGYGTLLNATTEFLDYLAKHS